MRVTLTPEARMRGDHEQQAPMWSYIAPEQRIPQDHPLRPLRALVDAVLKDLSPRFSRLYAKTGRPSVAPERLLRALIAAARLKNDRVDAERLALLLRGDLLPRVWIPPTALREARELIRHRIQLVWLRGVIRNRLPAMLARRNLQPTSGQSWLTQRGQCELQRLPLAETPSRIREDCGALLPTLEAQIRRLDAELVTRWGADTRV